MHATIDVRLTINIDEAKTVPLATLAEFISDQNVESVLLEALVESLDAARVEALYGENHATGNADQRFQFVLIPRGDGYITHTNVDPANVTLPDEAEIYDDREIFEERISDFGWS